MAMIEAVRNQRRAPFWPAEQLAKNRLFSLFLSFLAKQKRKKELCGQAIPEKFNVFAQRNAGGGAAAAWKFAASRRNPVSAAEPSEEASFYV
jgi:hypothetical protein